MRIIILKFEFKIQIKIIKNKILIKIFVIQKNNFKKIKELNDESEIIKMVKNEIYQIFFSNMYFKTIIKFNN